MLRALRPDEVGRSPCFGYGRGGVAYTLWKAGTLRDDPALVRSAQRWAAAGIRSGRRFHLRGWPRASFSRGLTGLYAIHALAAHAANDAAACRRELQRFVDSARRARGSVELFQGMAGRLAGAAIVARRLPDPGVRVLGDELAARILDALEVRDGRLAPSGVAHGWPGVVLAALAWQAVSRSLPRDALVRAVIAAHRHDRAAAIDRRRSDWAHGRAGMALLFARAYVQLGDRRFLGWAREAAAQARDLPSQGFALLGGAAGIAYGLLAVAAADPEGPWRDAAWTVAGEAFSRVDVPATDPYGVWSGLGGACCLALDLLHETEAGFPGVEA
ncbi:MAG TPA: lanthionine synthetase LanC family protein [Kofleriaceae bacterium]|nr:lanthionine synthetase LanC family protein [Kofleriaceae bacterium]